MNKKPMTHDEFLKGLLEKHGIVAVSAPHESLPQELESLHVNQKPDPVTQFWMDVMGITSVDLKRIENDVDEILKGLSDDE